MSVPADSVLASHDGLLCDLDGVVYAGPGALPDAVETLERARQDGLPIGFVTNNASRAPETVAAHLRQLGLDVTAEQVFGSAAAGARLARDDAERRAAESSDIQRRALVVGAKSLVDAARAEGFEVTHSRETSLEDFSGAEYVIQGFDPSIGWADLALAAHAIQRGATWIATNTDLTLPLAHGLAPGNGTFVAAVRQAVDVDPLVAGKPQPTLMHLAAERLGMSAPLMIGDRLDTDVAGGVAAGYDTALVLTGVDTVASALEAPAEQRPTLILRTLADLYAAPVSPEAADGAAAGTSGAAAASGGAGA